jgi:hypothetical protein
VEQGTNELGDVGSQRLLEATPDGAWASRQIGGSGHQVGQPSPVEGSVTRRVDLPSGGWVELRDPREIRAKHRKRVMDTLDPERMRAGTPGVAFDMTDGLMMMMVEKWSIPYLPAAGARPSESPASIDELTIPDYDRISDELEAAQKLIFPMPASIDDRAPGSPTRPASA